jgi:hypothetical protein
MYLSAKNIPDNYAAREWLTKGAGGHAADALNALGVYSEGLE